MIATITLWTMLLWAEPFNSERAMAVTQVSGFATQESCLAAVAAIVARNTQLANVRKNSWQRSRYGEYGVDFKLTVCGTVETPKN